MTKTGKVATVAGGLGLALAVSLGAVGCEEQIKTPRELGDAPIGQKNGDKKDIIEMPNGFPNVGMACDGHGHRVYVVSHGDKITSPATVIDDLSCPGGAAR